MSGFQQRLESLGARALLGLPESLLRPLAGPPIEKDGQTLDLQCQMLLKIMKTRGVALGGGEVDTARRVMTEQSGTLGPRVPADIEVRELSLAGDGLPAIGARFYRPDDANRHLPAIVFLHGGGFVVGDLESHDAVCRALAHHACCGVVAVDYRLAPESPAPAASQDAVAAFRTVVDQAEALGLDADRLAVAGDSAGGNLAAVVAQQTKNDVHAPCYQALFYPVVDFEVDHPSKDMFAEGYFLEKASMNWFEGHYVPAGVDKKDPAISPLYGDLAGVAPALIQTGGFDPLRDEGEAYAKALQDAGVAVTMEREPGLIHGYLNLAGGVRQADKALQQAASYIRTALHAEKPTE
ncbi:alpha/beta hydrolase [Salinisphaera japonica]|uniref:Alpha/beta hydrolase n=1 Tax=Salinisphaera japonica YTM-1 TaxID=1209778 RepID=A0A423Q264_9GAMM|nr:alpha/beta hydrolase [Salinisphaera japonica]ROO32699.1 alpha/beta hydrolase [Salinisphaera japonica YTM-1]